MDAAPGTTLIFSSMVGGSPKADSYNLLGFFGAFAESELSITVSGGMAKGPLVLGSDRELSPVTYENLNDLVLLYEGGKLTKVYAETGTEVSLTYDLNGRLVRVENTRTGTTKDMEYADGVLSKVVSKKAHS